MVAGVAALLCLGGAGVAFVAYREVTEPDRSAPDVAVDNYLRAFLVDRNDAQAGLYICDRESNLAAAEGLREEIERREAEFDVAVRISWGALIRSDIGDGRELVRTELAIASFSDGQARSRRNETWEFEVVDDGGWRVCLARKV
jgi:hypothetical protein